MRLSLGSRLETSLNHYHEATMTRAQEQGDHVTDGISRGVTNLPLAKCHSIAKLAHAAPQRECQSIAKEAVPYRTGHHRVGKFDLPVVCCGATVSGPASGSVASHAVGSL